MVHRIIRAIVRGGDPVSTLQKGLFFVNEIDILSSLRLLMSLVTYEWILSLTGEQECVSQDVVSGRGNMDVICHKTLWNGNLNLLNLNKICWSLIRSAHQVPSYWGNYPKHFQLQVRMYHLKVATL